ncbi:hypothetical protein C2G38_2082951 [Gigaspora rosea]|uniref:Uncharacterized protein n=1 Tax=Gigaspora rosea TaxID=44941 RepID=A0A397VAH9_9GLOM|nr:hypothetical protein C2G38_2082951 [Gigaspora rosea]
MVKASIILISLLLILHVHLTATSPAHVLEGRNLTMLPMNISGHKLEKRKRIYNFDPLNFNKKGKIIIRSPYTVPGVVESANLLLACASALQAVKFILCCSFHNRNTVIDEPRQFSPSFWSRMKLLVYNLLQYRLIADITSPRQDSPLLHPNNLLLSNLEGIYETRVQGPTFGNALDAFKRYSDSEPYKIPYCPNPRYLSTIPEEEQDKWQDICFPPHIENIIRPADPKPPKPKSKYYHPLLIYHKLSAASFYELYAFYDNLDEHTIQELWEYYARMSDKYPNEYNFFFEVKDWAESLGQSLREYLASNSHYEKGESSNSRRFMCDDADDDDKKDEFRK